MQLEISKVEYDTKVHLRVKVDCPPAGMRDLLCEVDDDDEDDVRDILTELARSWPHYWGETVAAVRVLFQRYEVENHLEDTNFRVLLQKSGGWVDDDFFLEVVFDDDNGFWAVFFKDGKVIHSQYSG